MSEVDNDTVAERNFTYYLEATGCISLLKEGGNLQRLRT